MFTLYSSQVRGRICDRDPAFKSVRLTCDLARYYEDQVHRDTNTDNGDRVYQAGAQEEGRLQLGSQFRLTGGALDQLAAQQAYADSGTKAIMMAAAM